MGADAETPQPPYLAGGLSEKGRRESNEDAAILAVLPASPALRAFAVLSDGMGGHNAGEVASRMTVEILREKVRLFAAREDATSLPPEALEAEIRGWIDDINREIHQRGKASAEQKGMGATVAFAMILADGRLVVANVGDSKIFLVSGLKVRQLSVDHTALAEQRRALGSDSVAPEDDSGNPFAHALTRSLGQEKKVVPDVRSDVILATGDAVILTTDGVTDVLEAERFLTALEVTGSLQETADEIYRLAFEAGSKDNVSVAILSRGTPARLGLGKTGRVPAVTAPAPGVEDEADKTLVAGAASGPPEEPAPRPRGRRLLAGGVALAAVVVAIAYFLWRFAPSPGKPAAVPRAARPTEAAPAPSTAAPVGTVATAATPAPVAAPAPAPTPVPATPAPSGKQQAGRGTSAPAVPRSAPKPPRATAEPSFRPPAVLSGLQPLEYPPTPTETPTATHTPTPTATDTATPTIPPPASGGKPAATPAPRPSASPAVSS